MTGTLSLYGTVRLLAGLLFFVLGTWASFAGARVPEFGDVPQLVGILCFVAACGCLVRPVGTLLGYDIRVTAGSRIRRTVLALGFAALVSVLAALLIQAAGPGLLAMLLFLACCAGVFAAARAFAPRAQNRSELTFPPE